MIDYWCVRESYLDRLSERARTLGAEGGEGLTSRPPPLPEPIALAPFDPGVGPRAGRRQMPVHRPRRVRRRRTLAIPRPVGGGRRPARPDRRAPAGDRHRPARQRQILAGHGRAGAFAARGCGGGQQRLGLLAAGHSGRRPVRRPARCGAPARPRRRRLAGEAKPALRAAPKKLPELVAAAAEKAAPSLLVVDEAGELFDMAPESSWAGFLAALVALAQRPSPPTG